MPTDSPERVAAYIDGLNVYEGLRQKRRRDLLWLDYRAMIESKTRRDQNLVAVYYFTAHRTTPPESYARQQIYFNALEARGGVDRIEGRYDKGKAPCVHCGRITHVPRERATDVNLASRMIHDAGHGHIDVVLLLSGDSDYLHPIEVVQSFEKRVTLLRPPGRRSDELARASDHTRDLNLTDFRRNQLPDPLPTGRGSEIVCPYEWLPLDKKAARLSPGHQRLVDVALAAMPDGHERHLESFVDQLHAAELKDQEAARR